MNPITSTIHLNGTSKEDLDCQIFRVRQALDCAIMAIEKAGPNARDYYPQEKGAFLIAQNEHRGRIERLVGVAKELEAIHEAIVNQGGLP